MWLVSWGPETNYNSSSLGRGTIRRSDLPEEINYRRWTLSGCAFCSSPSEVQSLASWCKDHECQSLSFVHHLALIFSAPHHSGLHLSGQPRISTELAMRHGRDVEISAPLYGDTDGLQPGGYCSESNNPLEENWHLCTCARTHTHSYTYNPPLTLGDFWGIVKS